MREERSWSLGEIARQVGGTLNDEKFADVEVTGAHFDTRQLARGDLFVPLVAERDGHDFLSQAFASGAAAAFWSRPLAEVPTDYPVIAVVDTTQAFWDWARAYIDVTGVKVVGITGSNGKTTTKDLTASVLSERFRTYKTQGNFNNEIGVPKTILEMSPNTEVIVLEMGMDRPGEIHELSVTFTPDVGIITMIGESHIEYFGSHEKIADGKVALKDGLKPTGKLFYLGDEPLLQERLRDVEIATGTFGFEETDDYYAYDVTETMNATRFYLNDELEEWEIPVPGKYNVGNALAAIAVGDYFNLTEAEIRRGLLRADLTANRLEWLAGPDGSHLLNDAYNASPTSMKAALRYFEGLSVDGAKKVVIGDMLELGELADEQHAALAREVDFSTFKHVYLYGEKMGALATALREQYPTLAVTHEASDREALTADIKADVVATDYLLFKSSLGTDVLGIVHALAVSETND